ncbi:MAG: cation:proton antiporter domain-containing protein [Longimicrobiales bacterium]
MTGFAILLIAAAVAFAFARWLDMAPIPFLVVAGMALARLDAFPVEMLQDAVIFGLTVVLFVSGTELSPGRVRGQRRTVAQVGVTQFIVLGVLGTGIALLLGYPRLPAVYVGLALAASSTLVIVRLLQRRRQLYEPSGRLVVGVLLLQDLLVILTIPLLTFVPAGIVGVLRGFAGIIVLLALAFACMHWVAPRIARLALEPEPLLLSALAVLSAFVALAMVLDVSIPVGAFLAGLALSPFPLRGVLRGQLTPINEFFAAIFFIALGGLIGSPGVLALLHAAVFVGLVLVVTPPLVAFVTQRAGFTTRSALESGLLLAQTSELSLVLVLQGMLAGQLGQETFSTLLLVTVTTMVLTPWLSSDAGVQRLLSQFPRHGYLLSPQEQAAEPSVTAPDDVPSGHVLLLGCGAGGLPLLETLFAAGHRVVAVDDDPNIVEQLRRGDVEVVRGDASDPGTLHAAGAAHALIISSTIRRPRDNQRLLETIRGVPVMIRVFEDDDADWVRAAGGIPIVYSDAAAEEFMRWFDRFSRPEAPPLGPES